MIAFYIGFKNPDDNYLTVFDSQEQAKKEAFDWAVVVAANEHAAKAKYLKELERFKNLILG